jgi:hypothetical protein
MKQTIHDTERHFGINSQFFSLKNKKNSYKGVVKKAFAVLCGLNSFISWVSKFR